MYLDLFIALFKDICPFEDVYDFCAFVREHIGTKTDEKFDGGKSYLSKLIVNAVQTRKAECRLYNKMCALFAETII